MLDLCDLWIEFAILFIYYFFPIVALKKAVWIGNI